MAEGILILIIGVTSCAMLAVCGRGNRVFGRSWFNIPHEAGRAARRRP